MNTYSHFFKRIMARVASTTLHSFGVHHQDCPEYANVLIQANHYKITEVRSAVEGHLFTTIIKQTLQRDDCKETYCPASSGTKQWELRRTYE